MRRSILFEGVTVTLLILLMSILIAMIMGASGPTERSIPGSDQMQYIYTGNDGTLYMFYENHIQAMNAKGDELWDFALPPQLKIAPGWRFSLNTLLQWGNPEVMIEPSSGPIVFADNNTLYVYVVPNQTYTTGGRHTGERMSEGLIAISGKGDELWSLPLLSLLINGTQYHPNGAQGFNISYSNISFSDAYIQAQNGRVYVFHDYNETVLDMNGTILWNIDGISAPVSVDEHGFVYCVPAMEPPTEYTQLYLSDAYLSTNDYLVPSAIVDAYYPNGTHYWRKYSGELLYRQYISDERLPLYKNGTIYAPLENGVVAYDRLGTEEWVKKYNPNDFYFQYIVTNDTGYKSNGITQSIFSIYGAMPFDSKGDVYVQYLSRNMVPLSDSFMSPSVYEAYLIVIGPDGREIARNVIGQYAYKAVSDGTAYNESEFETYPLTVSNLTSLRSKSLVAYNIVNGTMLWNYTFPVNDPTVVIVDASNAGGISPYLVMNYQYYVNDYNTMSTSLGRANLSTAGISKVIAGSGPVYVQFYSVNFEVPVVFGKSKAAYVSGVYAFGENGSLLWSKAIIPNALGMNVVNNSTIFYRDWNGNIVVTNTGAAVGFTITAILYIFIRFIFVGAVARARSQINKNERRNAVYAYIAKNPGLTLYDISRGLKMNIGTVRYHLFILGLNHRIVSYSETKFVRYFTNSNSFSKEDQAVISLVRRDSYGKLLVYMLTRRSVSNVEITKELGLQESLVSRCIKELAEKGIVVKEPSGLRGAYTIDDLQRERVASAIRHIEGE